MLTDVFKNKRNKLNTDFSRRTLFIYRKDDDTLVVYSFAHEQAIELAGPWAVDWSLEHLLATYIKGKNNKLQMIHDLSINESNQRTPFIFEMVNVHFANPIYYCGVWTSFV